MIEFHEVSVIDAPVTRCFDLARSVELHLLDNSHFGEPTVALPGQPEHQTTGLLGMGHQVNWRTRHLGVRQTLTTCITRFDPPVYFQNTMLRGVLRSMQHDHFFRALTGNRTEMTDELRVCAPLAVLGRIAELLVLRSYLRMLLIERSVVIKRAAESAEWQRYLPDS